MKVVLEPNQRYHILENPRRKMIIITCNEDFAVDDLELSGGSILQYRAYLGEPAETNHFLQNKSSVTNTCNIIEYYEKVIL